MPTCESPAGMARIVREGTAVGDEEDEGIAYWTPKVEGMSEDERTRVKRSSASVDERVA